MASSGALTGRSVSRTYRDLLKIKNEGKGLPAEGGNLSTVTDGDGNDTPLELSRTIVNIDGERAFRLNGVPITATAKQINNLAGFLDNGISGGTGEGELTIRLRGGTQKPSRLRQDEVFVHRTPQGIVFYVGDAEENVRPLNLNSEAIIDKAEAGGVASLNESGNVPDGQINGSAVDSGRTNGFRIRVDELGSREDSEYDPKDIVFEYEN